LNSHYLVIDILTSLVECNEIKGHNTDVDVIYQIVAIKILLLLLLGAELPLVDESFGLLNEIFPFPSILDAGYKVINLHLANILFDAILPSVLGSSL